MKSAIIEVIFHGGIGTLTGSLYRSDGTLVETNSLRNSGQIQFQSVNAFDKLAIEGVVSSGIAEVIIASSADSVFQKRYGEGQFFAVFIANDNGDFEDDGNTDDVGPHRA